jgi:DNA-binding protein HU-beta
MAKAKTPTKAAPKAVEKPAAPKAAAKKPAGVKKPMTKAEVIKHFAEKFQLPKNTTVAIFDELVQLSTNEAKKVGAFTVPGLGKVSLIKRKARMGRNPATGESIKIPAKTVVKMRLAKAFQDQIVPPKKK